MSHALEKIERREAAKSAKFQQLQPAARRGSLRMPADCTLGCIEFEPVVGDIPTRRGRRQRSSAACLKLTASGYDYRRWGRLSGRPDRTEELADLALEPAAFAGQRLRRGEHLRGGRSGFAGAALHVGDVGGDLLGAVRRLLH